MEQLSRNEQMMNLQKERLTCLTKQKNNELFILNKTEKNAYSGKMSSETKASDENDTEAHCLKRLVEVIEKKWILEENPKLWMKKVENMRENI